VARAIARVSSSRCAAARKDGWTTTTTDNRGGALQVKKPRSSFSFFLFVVSLLPFSQPIRIDI